MFGRGHDAQWRAKYYHLHLGVITAAVWAMLFFLGLSGRYGALGWVMVLGALFGEGFAVREFYKFWKMR